MARTIVVAACLGLSLASAAFAAGKQPSAFSFPSGLSMSDEKLLERLGQCPPHCVPMTSDTTYDLAYACFSRRMYADAIVFADHGLKLRDDARLHLIKGVSELNLGRCVEAEDTAARFQNAVNNRNTIGMAVAHERVNGPMRVRFNQILKHIAQTEKPLVG